MSIVIDRGVLRAAREAQLWTQEDLAAASGLSARTIQRIEAKGQSSKDSLQALAAALDVEAVDLIANEGVVEVEINRNWVMGPIVGTLGGLTGCFIGGRALIENIQETQADISTALPALSFLGIMIAFAVCFPAFMTYKYWNTSNADCSVP